MKHSLFQESHILSFFFKFSLVLCIETLDYCNNQVCHSLLYVIAMHVLYLLCHKNPHKLIASSYFFFDFNIFILYTVMFRDIKQTTVKAFEY